MIDFRDVSIHFGTQDVLRHATFRVNRGERVGIVGPNGAGKSTVFALITGEQQPDGGVIDIEGSPRIGHLHQQLHAHTADDTLLSYAMRAEPRLEELERTIHALEAQLATRSVATPPHAEASAPKKSHAEGAEYAKAAGRNDPHAEGAEYAEASAPKKPHAEYAEACSQPPSERGVTRSAGGSTPCIASASVGNPCDHPCPPCGTSAPEADAASRAAALAALGDAQTEYEHLGGYDLEARVKAALCGLGFHVADFQRPFSDFSGGWKMRAELVRSIITEPELLLLDEPSNYLDLPAVEWMQKFLREYEGTLLLISHDRFLLRTLTDTTVEIDGCTATRYSGGLDFYLRERQTRYATLVAAKKNQDRLREQTQRFIDPFRYTPTKAAQVQSAVKRLEKMEEIVVPRQASSAGHLRLPPAERSGTTVLRLEDAGFTYDGERWIFRHLSFDIARGDRVAIVGYNGMGKTTLSRLLAGMRKPSEGLVDFGTKVVPGYVSQEFSEIIPPERSLLQAIRLADPAFTEAEARSLLGAFGFSGDDAFKESGVLSGGEKIRLAFARLYAQKPNLLVLDEPTTHLDLNGRAALEKSLAAYEGTVVVISHDVEFIRAVGTRIVAFEDDGLRLFGGTYDDYRARKDTATSATDDAAPQAGGAQEGDAPSPQPEKRLSAKELRIARAEERARIAPRRNDLKRRVEQSEARIMALEEEQKALVASLEAAEPGLDFAAVNRRLAEIQRDLDVVNTLWEQAAAELSILEST